MSAPDDDVPSGEELFASAIADLRAEGMTELEATLRAALTVAGWIVAQTPAGIIAETIADLKPAMDDVHRELDRLVEDALHTPQRRRQ